MGGFSQLLMRKKEQIMYATIKGSLTENDGVFSGFSASNYLAISNIPTYTQDDRVEFVFNFTLNELGNGAIFSGAGSIVVPLVEANGKIVYYSSIIGNISGTTVLSVGQNYYLKIIIDTNLFSAYISTDGQNWALDRSKSLSDTFSKSGVFVIGKNPTVSTQYLRGSIDINRSYIKINSTKYNLQAVVGYTIVGSPTIVDGVVSRFSSANYLTLPLDKNVSNITEYVFKFKLTSEGLRNQYNYLFRRGNFQFSIYGSTNLTFSIPNMYLPTYNQNIPLTGFVPLVDNWYWVKYTYDGTNVNLYSSIDGINWILRNTVTNVTVAGISGTFYLGFADNNVNNYFGGEIDLNETYIKVNNKLWFNGQQA